VKGGERVGIKSQPAYILRHSNKAKLFRNKIKTTNNTYSN
jgi:hypothetical protein